MNLFSNIKVIINLNRIEINVIRRDWYVKEKSVTSWKKGSEFRRKILIFWQKDSNAGIINIRKKSYDRTILSITET